MAYISTPNTLTNGTTADADDVMGNFNAVTSGLADGTKDIGVNGASFAGAIDANGALSVAGAFTASGTLTSIGAADFESTVQVADTMTVSGAATFAASFTADGLAQFNSAATFADTFTVDGVANFGSSAVFNDQYTMSGSDLGTSSAPTANTVYPNSIIKAWANVGSGGTFNGGVNLTVSRISVGIYNYTFRTNMSDANYSVIVTPAQNMVSGQYGDHYGFGVNSFAVNGFTVNGWNTNFDIGGDTIDETDLKHTLVVIGNQ